MCNQYTDLITIKDELLPDVNPGFVLDKTAGQYVINRMSKVQGSYLVSCGRPRARPCDRVWLLQVCQEFSQKAVDWL